MYEKDFVSKIKWIKKELLALKQAHMHGLGVVDFYSETNTTSITPTGRAPYMVYKVQFESETVSPFCQLYTNVGASFDFEASVWDDTNKTMTFYALANIMNNTFEVKSKVVASAPIESITVTEGWY